MSDLDLGWGRLHSATLATWTSILRSTGFHGSFVTWWFTEVGPVFPLQPPEACYAQWICETLRDREAQWRSMCRQHRQQHISQVFQQDWKQGAAKHFKAVKPPGLPRVDSLDVFTSHHITVCRSRKKGLQRCQLQDEDLHCIKIGATWKQAKAEAKVVDVSKGVIKLRKIKGHIDNGEICQYTPTAVPKAILHEAKTYWNQFWNTKRDEQPGDAMIQDAISALPQLSEMNPDFDMNDLEWALRKLQIGKAKGMDGFSNFELKMALLNKTDQIGDISTTRPITILATVYRPVLECINKRLGMQSAWQPYQKFLNSLQRHFTCGGSWGPAITAKIGVPEGCPVAVVQMMVMTWMFTAVMKQQADVELFSYVDDWMMMTKHPEKLVYAIQQLDKLARKAKVLLNRLQYMPWDRRRKVAILTRGIYPLIFFGVQCWPTGKDFLREVRAKSNHTIWGKQQYHLHFLAPLFSGGNYEPMPVVAMSRFRAFMRMFTQHMEQTKRVWKTSVEKKTFFKNQTKGIVCLFQNQLLELDWALQEDGRCTTSDGWTFVVWDITLAQFEKRVTSSWEDKLLLQLQPKQYLPDLYSFSATRSQYPRHKDAMLEGFINKMRLGGLFPNQRKNKVHVQNDDCCAYCGEVDTMTHRVFSCPATEHLRSGDIWEAVRNMPTSQLFGALYPKLPLVDEYKQLLKDVQHDDIYALDATSDEHIFFTDGSAVDNELDDLRLCSWADCSQEINNQFFERNYMQLMQHSYFLNDVMFIVTTLRWCLSYVLFWQMVIQPSTGLTTGTVTLLPQLRNSLREGNMDPLVSLG
ncbi:unnamed protein product [Symbiodinium necroappetens]|uniref:Reverse transcriptase domain-containing protein n=1 Tax=Symbiodinium necroappetens TaxID=1628268 RepID=A0A813B934_9DINO|nr:unnamed protein product [Symbiodinium necroappetens]